MSDSARLQLLRTFALAEIPVALDWTHDGRFLAAGGADGEIVVVDTFEDRTVGRLQAHARGLFQLAWQPRGRQLLTCGQDGMARLWMLVNDTLSRTAELEMDRAWVEHCAWQPSGSAFAVAAGRVARVFDARGCRQHEYTFAGGTIAALGWRPQGAQLALAGYQGVELHSPADPRSRARKLPWPGAMVSLAWRPDGTVVACGCQDSTVHFWRLREGQEAWMSGYETKPKHLAWSRDGEWLATSGSPDVTLWRFRKGSPEGTSPTTLRRHRAPLQALAFAPKGRRLVSGCEGGLICLWTQMEDFVAPAAVLALDAGVESVAFSPAGAGSQLAVGDATGGVHIVAVA